MSLDEFIARAKLIHEPKGRFYDYSKVVYINKNTPVEIICPIHGSFMQRPHDHLSKRAGCPKCKNRMTNEEFIKSISEEGEE
jgi:hypothetical protein